MLARVHTRCLNAHSPIPRLFLIQDRTPSSTRSQRANPAERPRIDYQLRPTPTAYSVIPNPPARKRGQARRQTPIPCQQIALNPGRNHRRGDEPLDQGQHHQHRRQHRLLLAHRDPNPRELRIRLRLIPMRAIKEIRRIDRYTVHADLLHRLVQVHYRLRPANSIRDQRHQDRRDAAQRYPQLANPRR